MAITTRNLVPWGPIRTGSLSALLVLLFSSIATPGLADKSGQTTLSVSSVAASGKGSNRARQTNSSDVETVQNVTSVLQAASSDQAGRAANSRNDRQERRASHQGKIEMVRTMTRLTQLAYTRTRTLYAEYDRLNTMTPEQALAAYPNGDHFEHLHASAVSYNAAVDVYYLASRQLNRAKAGLTGGQALSGGVVAELNALLGQ